MFAIYCASLQTTVKGGCTTCEVNQCDTSVGYGNHPDTSGGVSLDALIMDGQTFNVGSVGFLTKYRNAATVARLVMEYTTHTLLVGEGAEEFAHMMGVPAQSTVTNQSLQVYEAWKEDNCQPNFYTDLAGSEDSCPPYAPPTSSSSTTTTTPLSPSYESLGSRALTNRPENSSSSPLPATATVWATPDNHDTIGMVAVDAAGHMACGTTTNGANHKVRGRVGDSPIAGEP